MTDSQPILSMICFIKSLQVFICGD